MARSLQRLFRMTAAKVVAVATYMLAASLLLVVNKLSVGALPNAGVLLALQVAVTTAVSGAVGARAALARVVQLRAACAPFACFLLCLVANLESLRRSNVETLVVLRSTAPIVVGVCDWACLGREFPSAKSWASMGGHRRRRVVRVAGRRPFGRRAAGCSRGMGSSASTRCTSRR